MTDPEALAQKMADATDAECEVGVYTLCARAAVDFFAARVARADAIEAAARQMVDLCALTGVLDFSDAYLALRAALEAS